MSFYADKVSKYRETADMYSEFSPSHKTISMATTDSTDPPPIPRRNQRVKFDEGPQPRGENLESSSKKGLAFTEHNIQFI